MKFFMVIFWWLAACLWVQGAMVTLDRDMTAGAAARFYGVGFNDLKVANKTILSVSTLLKKGAKLKLPEGSDIDILYYQQDYLAAPAVWNFWDKESNGHSLALAGEYRLRFKRSNRSDIVVGGSAEGGGGNLSLTGGLYQESFVHWQAGARIRWQKPTGLFYEVSVAYGQNVRQASLATGLNQKLFSHYLMVEGVFHPYAKRTLRDIWFNDASLTWQVKLPLKEDKFFWAGQPINLMTLSQVISLSGELSMIDWNMSQKFILPLGASFSLNLYDWSAFKFFSSAQIFIEPIYDGRPIGRVMLLSQAGDGLARLSLGLNFDFGFFLKRNEPTN